MDAEVLTHSEIVRRDVDRESTERALAVIDPAVLDTIFTSRDPAAIVQRMTQIADALMEAVRQRDLSRRFGDSTSEFFNIEAWQYLSTMLGMSVVGTGSRPLPDGSGWEASAELRHVATGRVLGAREAMCQRTEPGKTKAPENTLRQMAQLRAARAAARSVLGFVPRIGGIEIADPEALATDAQVGLLHQLERLLGMDHDEGHRQAGVDSYRQLSREAAAEVIDLWTRALESGPETRHPHSTPSLRKKPLDSVGDLPEQFQQLAIDMARAEDISLEEAVALIEKDLVDLIPTPGGEAEEERPDKRTGEDEAAVKSSPAGRKKSAAPGGLLSTSDRAAEGPAAGSGRPAAGPQPDHVHDWGPAPSAEMAKRGWKVCLVCRKAIGPGEQG